MATRVRLLAFPLFKHNWCVRCELGTPLFLYFFAFAAQQARSAHGRR